MPGYDMDKAIQEGIGYLDRYRPNWFNDLDLVRLDISNPLTCICTQLNCWPDKMGTRYSATDIGFDITWDDSNGDWHKACSQLTEKWTKIILERRQMQKSS